MVTDQNKPVTGEDLPPLQELAGKNYATLRQVAKLTGRTYQTILRYIKPDPNDPDKPPRLLAVKVGGEWRVYEDELRRFLTHGNNA